MVLFTLAPKRLVCSREIPLALRQRALKERNRRPLVKVAPLYKMRIAPYRRMAGLRLPPQSILLHEVKILKQLWSGWTQRAHVICCIQLAGKVTQDLATSHFPQVALVLVAMVECRPQVVMVQVNTNFYPLMQVQAVVQAVVQVEVEVQVEESLQLLDSLLQLI